MPIQYDFTPEDEDFEVTVTLYEQARQKLASKPEEPCLETSSEPVEIPKQGVIKK